MLFCVIFYRLNLDHYKREGGEGGGRGKTETYTNTHTYIVNELNKNIVTALQNKNAVYGVQCTVYSVQCTMYSA